jgi:hypothetical protein
MPWKETDKKEGCTGAKRRARKKTEDRLQARVKAREVDGGFQGAAVDGVRGEMPAADGAGRGGEIYPAVETPEKGGTAHVKAVFDLLFRKYGLPLYIRSGNGPPLERQGSGAGIPGNHESADDGRPGVF